jgi:hypothetical protein
MKTRHFTIGLTALVLAGAVLLTSCRKKQKEDEDSDVTAANDNTLAESTSNDVLTMAGQASENGSFSSYRVGAGEDVTGLSCATISVTGAQQITATFSGGACLDGKTRSGSLTFDFSGSTNGATAYRHPGFKCVITSSNYVVNSHSVTVSKTITNTTPVVFNPQTTNLTWNISSSISIVKPNGGGTINWSCPGRTQTLLNTSDTSVYHGASTPITWYKNNGGTVIGARVGITGSANCTSTNGSSFTVNITSQLVKDFTCSPDALHPGHHPFIQGTLDFTPGSKATRHVDYGNGSCDFNATVTINGHVYNITLP